MLSWIFRRRTAPVSDFSKLLRGVSKSETNASTQLPSARAPEPVYRAYVDLVKESFSYFRMCVEQPNSNKEELHDIADALHNISGILVAYGSWIDDAEYRRLYIRRFDDRWASSGFGMEAFLDARIAYHSQKLANQKS